MCIATVRSIAFVAIFAGLMDVQAIFTESTMWKVLALLSWMEILAGLGIFTEWVEATCYWPEV